MRFEMRNSLDNNDLIEWETEVDMDGDFVVSANGHALFHIDGEDGKLWLYEIEEYQKEDLKGLKFEESKNNCDCSFLKTKKDQ